jgi:hypothetical protein
MSGSADPKSRFVAAGSIACSGLPGCSGLWLIWLQFLLSNEITAGPTSARCAHNNPCRAVLLCRRPAAWEGPMIHDRLNLQGAGGDD